MQRDFNELHQARQQAGFRVCVGIDPDIDKFPERLRKKSIHDALYTFCMGVIMETHHVAAIFKLNLGFFLAYGAIGISVLERIIRESQRVAPEVPVILDAKSGEIGNSMQRYAFAAFDNFGADAITVNPYMGGRPIGEAILDKYPDKGVFALCHTSNDGWEEFQDFQDERGQPVYEHVARQFSTRWNYGGNVGLVVGAKVPEHLAKIRQIVHTDTPILIPGVGAQGGDLEGSVIAAAGPDRVSPFLVNSSRGIIYSGSPARAAEALHQQILAVLQLQYQPQVTP